MLLHSGQKLVKMVIGSNLLIYLFTYYFQRLPIINNASRNILRDFPGGPVVKTPPANAGTWVQFPVWGDATCHRATGPMCHNY